MLTKWNRFFKRLAISLLALVVLVLVVKFIRRTFFPKAAPVSALASFRPGSKISIPEVKRADYQRTLILYLRRECPYCKASAPFYQRLVQETAGLKDVRLIAMLPGELNDSRNYLNDMGLSKLEVVQAEGGPFDRLPTPALIMVNNEGTILGLWIGQLKSEGESNLLVHLHGSGENPAKQDDGWRRWEGK